MSGFLASDWTLAVVLIWVPAMLIWRLWEDGRRRAWESAWDERFTTLAREGATDKHAQALRMLDERAAWRQRQARVDAAVGVVAVLMLVLAAVRLPFL